jgi:hypothetical protein
MICRCSAALAIARRGNEGLARGGSRHTLISAAGQLLTRRQTWGHAEGQPHKCLRYELAVTHRRRPRKYHVAAACVRCVLLTVRGVS